MLFIPDLIGRIWQVFWLGFALNTFPLISFTYFNSGICSTSGDDHSYYSTMRPPYSYGDSTGLSPDFPFHPPAGRKPNRHKCREEGREVKRASTSASLR
jgi:hypothetical protein